MNDQTGPAPLSWCDALEAEFQALYGVPALGDDAPRDPEARLRAVHARIHAQGPSAVCLSGGGVRSATFALGVLQGLAHVGVLRKVDYLSTVSGGGYIGGWLTAWLHRAGPGGQAEVMRQLDPEQSGQVGSLDTETPVDRVRRTARYLALQGGVVSADMWTLVTTMARNLFLNWLVLLPLLAAALLVPHIYYAIVHAIEVNTPPAAVCGWAQLRPGPRWLLLAGLAGFLISSSYVVLTFIGAGGTSSQGRFLSLFLVPAVVGAVAATLFWSATPCNLDARLMVGLAAGVPMAGWLVVAAGRRLSTAASTGGNVPGIRVGPRTLLGSIVAGAVLGGGAYWFAMTPFGFGHELQEFYAAFAVPILLGLTVAAMMLFAGIASTEQDDAALEWWSRCGAWLAIAATLWVAAGVLVFYLAEVIEAGVHWVARVSPLDHWSSSAGVAVLAPLLSSLAGLAMRNSSGGGANRPSTLKRTLESLALPLVIVALLSTIAWADLRALTSLEYHLPTTHPRGAGLGEVLLLFGALAGFALLMSRLIPANRFSLHGMYRQRLIRTFLGASRADRSPNAFTGFDSHDDLRVHDLRDVRPLHIINTTLNAMQSTHVGRHETKAESFTFSPLHVGNRFLGYRPAPQYGSDGDGRGSGLSLGMALAVSGAAASSAMGMYSTKARAFLLTLANARLGLWFGNPQSAKTWQRSEPPVGVEPIAREMLGLTTDNNPYVYLSDGGHYENLALWEMVARRCRYIVVSDAGCDPEYSFGDLSNAVRRIRLDLGIPMLFGPLTETREGQGRTNQHGAIGTIKYSAIDGPGAPDGTILYLKATLSGDESVDVRNFASADPLFPHDSTSDQFFDEARFESYRALGYHTVLSVTAGLRDLDSVEQLCTVARKTLAPARPAASAAV
ncbi:MAG TPA: hypothetical protein VMN81_09395 [Vicinamibacterales bacterium]|nr:hypothetical protein [Vicinamibacterales bacterium]